MKEIKKNISQTLGQVVLEVSDPVLVIENMSKVKSLIEDSVPKSCRLMAAHMTTILKESDNAKRRSFNTETCMLVTIQVLQEAALPSSSFVRQFDRSLEGNLAEFGIIPVDSYSWTPNLAQARQ